MPAVVTGLRVEYGTDPRAVGVAEPRLSWLVEWDTSVGSQAAYEISAHNHETGADATTGVGESADSVFVPWPFDPLASRERHRVRVRVISSTGEASEWSDPLDLEVGLLNAADWAALPITASRLDVAPERPIRFRRTFQVQGGLVRARLYASALGIYTAECNGQAIGDEVLAPGWTSYHHRLRYQSFDVAELIEIGDNWCHRGRSDRRVWGARGNECPTASVG